MLREIEFWMSMANVLIATAIAQAVPPFLAIVAAGALFRWLGWWT